MVDFNRIMMQSYDMLITQVSKGILVEEMKSILRNRKQHNEEELLFV